MRLSAFIAWQPPLDQAHLMADDASRTGSPLVELSAAARKHKDGWRQTMEQFPICRPEV